MISLSPQDYHLCRNYGIKESNNSGLYLAQRPDFSTLKIFNEPENLQIQDLQPKFTL